MDELERAGAGAFTRAEMRAALAGDEEPGVLLRRLRRRLMLRLAFRDLNGLAGLAEVFETMTAFA